MLHAPAGWSPHLGRTSPMARATCPPPATAARFRCTGASRRNASFEQRPARLHQRGRRAARAARAPERTAPSAAHWGLARRTCRGREANLRWGRARGGFAVAAPDCTAWPVPKTESAPPAHGWCAPDGVKYRLCRGNLGRGDRIRTCDPHTPSVMRYQAALRPDRGCALYAAWPQDATPKRQFSDPALPAPSLSPPAAPPCRPAPAGRRVHRVPRNRPSSSHSR